jgi:hypothetical protein
MCFWAASSRVKGSTRVVGAERPAPRQGARYTNQGRQTRGCDDQTDSKIPQLGELSGEGVEELVDRCCGVGCEEPLVVLGGNLSCFAGVGSRTVCAVVAKPLAYL